MTSFTKIAGKPSSCSGLRDPLIGLVHNIGYVLVSVAGGVLVMRGSIEIDDIQAFNTYSRQFTQPITQTANIANIIQSQLPLQKGSLNC